MFLDNHNNLNDRIYSNLNKRMKFAGFFSQSFLLILSFKRSDMAPVIVSEQLS